MIIIAKMINKNNSIQISIEKKKVKVILNFWLMYHTQNTSKEEERAFVTIG